MESVILREQWGRSRLSGDAFADPSSEKEDHIGMAAYIHPKTPAQLRPDFWRLSSTIDESGRNLIAQSAFGSDVCGPGETSEDVGRCHLYRWFRDT